MIVSTSTYLPNTIGSYPSCNHGSSSVSRCTGVTASLGPVRAHYPCFMCCSSSSPSCLTCTSGKLSTTSSTSATVERGMMGKARSETIILCFKHLRSLHFDRFIKTLSHVQNKLSGLENSIKDISSRHDSKVGFYAFKVLPAF